MEITTFGRIVKDAIVRKTKTGKELVEFNLVHNDPYKPKGQDEYVDDPVFFKCTIWDRVNAAKILKKGAIIEVRGRFGADGFKGDDGKIRVALVLTVDKFIIHGWPTKSVQATERVGEAIPVASEMSDDLPF